MKSVPRGYGTHADFLDMVRESATKRAEAIQAELREAFALFWSNPAASAGRIRVSIEALLDSLGIRRRRRIRGGFHELSLHERLERLKLVDPVPAAELGASPVNQR